MKQSEENWLRKNFPHLRNAVCAVYLGKHPRTITRMARKLGLYKSPEFMRTTQVEARKAAAEVNSKRLKGCHSPNLQKGTNLMRLRK